MITFQEITGKKKWKFIGVYIPPSEEDGQTIQQLEMELNKQKNDITIVAGDLNVDYIRPERSTRNIKISTTTASFGLSEITQHFYQRHKHRFRWTWTKKMENNTLRSRTDAILSNNREIFQNIQITDPPRCSSDHLMLVATMNVSTKEHKIYIKGRKHIPFPEQYDFGNTEEMDQMLTDLTQHCEKCKPQERNPKPDWIANDTWEKIAKRATLSKVRSTNEEQQELGKQIKKLLDRDRKNRAKEAGIEIENALQRNDSRGAYNIAKRWYRQVTGKSPPPAREDLEETAQTFQTLYASHGNEEVEEFELPTETNKRPQVDDNIPTIEEIIKQIKHLHNNRAPGFTGMKAEDIKKWASEYENCNDADKNNLPFTKLVNIIQTCFATGTIPKALHISTLVLIPKPNSRDYRGIGLLEILWKLMTAIIDNRLRNTINFQEEIHGFRKARGTGTAILGNKLLCQQSNIDGRWKDA